MKTFDELQVGLGEVLAANTPGSGTPHVVIALPSYSMNESLLSHYGERVLALEHRYLLAGLMTQRIADVELVYLSSLAPTPEVLRYYRNLGPRPDDFQDRARFVSVEDRSVRCMADKLLGRPDLMERLCELVDGRLAMIEPWNVTEHEVAVAEHLQVPINGMDPGLRHLGFKSAGRRLFREAGVPVPWGVEDVCTVEELVDSVVRLQRARPQARGAVVKHDDSGAGDGNVVIDLPGTASDPLDGREIRRQVEGLPDWYLNDLRQGAVVEELVCGAEFSSPSAQVDLLPDGSAVVLATHEQELGGDRDQIFLGCRFPAEPAYAGELAGYAQAVGSRLAALGARGRISVDFAAARDEGERWRVYALEVNLRKGGTTHAYAALRNLVPGRYDAQAGTWTGQGGDCTAYVCTDNLIDPSWIGMAPGQVIAAIEAAGIGFDHRTRLGVVLHMLAGLGIDGRIGLIAFGRDPAQARAFYGRAAAVIAQAGADRAESSQADVPTRLGR